MCFSGYRRNVWVDQTVAGVWHAHRQTEANAAESFGVLVGSTLEDRREMCIEAVTTPMELDQRWRNGFQLLDPGHQEFVDKMFKRSNGSTIYLGTWHTHPESRPAPSNVDKNDWRLCHWRNRKRPLTFVIVGIEEVRVYLRWGMRFRRLKALAQQPQLAGRSTNPGGLYRVGSA